MDEGLMYSDDARLNRLLFYQSKNDINLIVEDDKKEYVYEIIFNRLFNKKLKINKILAMNGKKGVIKSYREYGDNYNGKKIIYLVDGDFDLMLNKEIVESSCFIYLDRYNIESYYIDKESIINFMCGKLQKVSRDVADLLKLECWIDNAYDMFEKLFLNYVISQKINPGKTTLSIKPYIYLDDDGLVSENKVNEYIQNIKKLDENYEQDYELCLRRYDSILQHDPKRLICGKYLISSVCKYLRIKADVNIKEDEFKFWLINTFDTSQLLFIKDRINSIL